MLLRFKIF